MGHAIEQSADESRATFVAVEEHGWHGLGTLSDTDLSVTEAMKIAHLSGLEYQMKPSFVPIEGKWRATDRWATVRRNPFDRDQWDVLGDGLSSDFVLHTPEVALAFGEQVIAQGHPLAALGSIDSGRKAFAAFRLDDVTIGGVDQVHMFLNVMTAFDGSMATTARVSAIRVVCQNTFNAVLGQAALPTYRVRHQGIGLQFRVDDARRSLEIGWKGMAEFQHEAELLMKREITKQEFDKIVTALIPVGADLGDRAKNNRAKEQNEVRAIYDSPSVATIKGTAWGALNAYTEWVDWKSGRLTDASRAVARITPGSVLDQRRLIGGDVVVRTLDMQIPRMKLPTGRVVMV